MGKRELGDHAYVRTCRHTLVHVYTASRTIGTYFFRRIYRWIRVYGQHLPQSSTILS